MKTKFYGVILSLLMMTFLAGHIDGQAPAIKEVDLMNAPVLFKEGGKSYQQVVASYRSEKPGKIA